MTKLDLYRARLEMNHERTMYNTFRERLGNCNKALNDPDVLRRNDWVETKREVFAGMNRARAALKRQMKLVEKGLMMIRQNGSLPH